MTQDTETDSPKRKRKGASVLSFVLLAMVVGGQKNLRMLVIWGLAACASLVAHRYLPENSHVVVGALAGGLLGMVWTEQTHER